MGTIAIHAVGEHHLSQIFRERRSATATVAHAGKGVCVRRLPWLSCSLLNWARVLHNFSENAQGIYLLDQCHKMIDSWYGRGLRWLFFKHSGLTRLLKSNELRSIFAATCTRSNAIRGAGTVCVV